MNTQSIADKNNVLFRAAQRKNHSLTAAVEGRVLRWTAERAPQWLTSDQLTVTGFIAQLGAGACYALSRYDRKILLLVIPCLALNWLGDSLDGTLARVRRIERPRYGFYVDHIADIFGATALIYGLLFSNLVHWQSAMAMLVAFLILSSESFLAAYTLSCFELSQSIFGPTEIRLLLAAGTLALLRSPYATVFGRKFLLFDLGGAIAAIGMLAVAIFVVLRHTAELYCQEPLP